MNASQAADILGINRTIQGDLGPMVKALGLFSWNNTPEDEQRWEAAKWAIKNWKAYQAECNRRRDLRYRR